MDAIAKYVFVNGPAWLGSWEGQSSVDICSGITKVDAAHWSKMQDACDSLITRKVHASLIGYAVIGAAAVAYAALQTWCNRLVFAAAAPTIIVRHLEDPSEKPP